MLIKPIRQSELSIKPIKTRDMGIKPIKQSEINIKPIKKGEMPIKPANINNSNTSFRAIIKPSQALENGFKMALNLSENSSMKDLKAVKQFCYSLQRIKADNNIKEFIVNITSHADHKTPQINGKNFYTSACSCPNVQDSYLAIETCNSYAKKLTNNIPESPLEIIEKKMETLNKELETLKENYGNILKTELEKLQKEIIK